MNSLREASGDRPVVRGHDLCAELIGRRSFTEVAYLDITGEVPAVEVTRMLDAILVTLVEHGLTPSAIAARLTAMGEPSSIQGAVASGLLGAGERYLGSIEQAADMLRATTPAEGSLDEAAAGLVKDAVESGRRLPGYGHPIHRNGDPRVSVLTELAEELELPSRHLAFAHAVGRQLNAAGRVDVPLNAAGAIGAIVIDLGLPPRFGRALAILARSAGLIAHVFEEEIDPIGPQVWEHARLL